MKRKKVVDFLKLLRERSGSQPRRVAKESEERSRAHLLGIVHVDGTPVELFRKRIGGRSDVGNGLGVWKSEEQMGEGKVRVRAQR